MQHLASLESSGAEGIRARFLARGGGRIDRAEVRRRAGSAMARNLPTFRDCAHHARTWAIVGGGPSAAGELAAIRALQRKGANIVSVNKSHDCAKRMLMDGIIEDGVHG